MKDLAANSSGATAIEYALIASFLSVMIVTGATSVGTKLSTFFSSLATGLK